MVQCTKAGWGGTTKKSKALSKQLWIPCKSPTSESNDGDDNRFTFGRMIDMMMMQNRDKKFVVFEKGSKFW
jgi:hypothetical protein